MTSLLPLEAAAIDAIDVQETRAEKIWKRIPVLGWFVGSYLWDKRTSPIVTHIENQLTRRPEPKPSIWGNGLKRTRIGLFLSQVAQEEMGWSNNHFIPADPVKVVFWAHEDGLDFEMALLRIEEEMDVSISNAEAVEWFGRTLSEVVDFLLNRQEPSK